MKRKILTFAMAALLTGYTSGSLFAQDQPEPKKDTVNIDTEAKPTFYYAVEDEKVEEKGNGGIIAIAGAAVIVLGTAGFFLLKKKK